MQSVKAYNIALALVFMVILPTGCQSLNNTYTGNVPEGIRRIFVGIWEGKHADNEGKLVRTWIQRRSEDGTYSIVFFHHKEEGVLRSRQLGRWWIDGDRFYEIAPDVMKKPDIYEFEILSEDAIRFKSIEKDYEFIDRRIKGLRRVKII